MNSLQLSNPKADVFVPDGKDIAAALSRTTHIGVGAHQDDLEIMAHHGILECFNRQDKWFLGVTATSGAGAPRDGVYANTTDAELQLVRQAEQRKAAMLGEYGAVIQLMFSSAEIKNTEGPTTADLYNIFKAAKPEVVYTHNFADKHDTHVAVALRVVEAIRLLPKEERPLRLYGCEVWRGLDWLWEGDKVIFDVSRHPNLGQSLVGVYDSQIQAKRYDNAVVGRRRANATFLDSHYTDKIDEAIYAVDMTAMILDDNLDPAIFLASSLDNFKNEVIDRVTKFTKA
ncbi:MAG: PIG-L family deacetylase [Defluviitaleaceae bacterium]|nr:PIG-L family deacetylase [Defluviitaleaceae bacterium]